jgi:hypothetical protein
LIPPSLPKNNKATYVLQIALGTKTGIFGALSFDVRPENAEFKKYEK